MAIDEAEYHDLVAAWIEESFADVEHEPRVYDDDGGYVIPDFVAHTPFESYVIEVESRWRPYNAIGQARVYAVKIGHDPVVVFPADSVEEPTFTELSGSDDTPIIETV